MESGKFIQLNDEKSLATFFTLLLLYINTYLSMIL